MICHLPSDPLAKHAAFTLSELSPSCKSWFFQVRDICMQYGLPPPLELLENPVPKEGFKNMVKLKVQDYWHSLLTSEIQTKPSLLYFRPSVCSLSRPHNLWTSSAGNPFECSKSTVLCRMMSGRYRTEVLSRHWSENFEGFCRSPSCHRVLGDLEHLLAECPALDHTRDRVFQMWLEKTSQCLPLNLFIQRLLISPPNILVQFILEPRAFPEVISLFQQFGQDLENLVAYLTRTFAFSIHREKSNVTSN